MILEKLSNAMGVAGNEDAVREIILDAVKPHVDEITVDSMGNLIALKKGAPRRSRTSARIAARPARHDRRAHGRSRA